MPPLWPRRTYNRPMKQRKRKPGGPTAESIAAIAGVSVQLVYRKLRMGKSAREIVMEAETQAQHALKHPVVNVAEVGLNGHAGNGALSFAAAQAAKENALAELRQLEVMERRRELMPVSYVRIWGTRFLVEGRDILLAGPSELADTLAAETDPLKTAAILRAWLDRAMGKFHQLDRLWSAG